MRLNCTLQLKSFSLEASMRFVRFLVTNVYLLGIPSLPIDVTCLFASKTKGCLAKTSRRRISFSFVFKEFHKKFTTSLQNILGWISISLIGNSFLLLISKPNFCSFHSNKSLIRDETTYVCKCILFRLVYLHFLLKLLH